MLHVMSWRMVLEECITEPLYYLLLELIAAIECVCMCADHRNHLANRDRCGLHQK